MEHSDYFNYLRSRTRLGWLYRMFWLYPRLALQLRGRVIDVGCGIGDMLRFRRDTVGVDINPQLVDWARQQGLDAHLVVNGAFPFESSSFDGALLDNVVERLTEPGPLLAEVRRVLKPGGTLVVGVPGRKGFGADPDHKIYYDKDSLCACLGAAGFSAPRHFYMPLPWRWLDSRISQYCLYVVFRCDS